MPSLLPEDDNTGPVNATPQEVADYLMSPENAPPAKAEVGLVGMCYECKNIQPDNYMEKSPFYNEGAPVPCRFCGGVTMIVREDLIDNHLKQRLDQMRGIGSTKSVG